MSRDLKTTIRSMMKRIPREQRGLRLVLTWIVFDIKNSSYESSRYWSRAQEALKMFIPKPVQDWEYQVLSLFTNKSITKLKEYDKQH